MTHSSLCVCVFVPSPPTAILIMSLVFIGSVILLHLLARR